ncbi:phage tail protein [Dactylosporangium sp. NPDC049525]|jgi:phage tail-like protein|uniref:phage tail protein n=1 Tax=Dactylosporangium sp. NPDC049525 TaxID=3154730 RepID=UPI0034281030
MGNPANTLRFNVTIDGQDLGSFTALDGLTAEYEVKTYQEGGENGFVHQLPGRLKFGNIKLSRPVDLQSKALGAWFHLLAKGIGTRRHTATVVAFNDNGEPVAEWTFVGVWPVKYTGPSFSTETAKVAIEAFEFAHNGQLG